jgi:drug/metabolite transporter (DMT)-like permease
LTKVAVKGFDPFLTATGRAAIAGVLASALLVIRRVPRPPRAYLLPLLATMLGAVFGWPILLALALQRTTSAHAAVIASFMPLTTALIAVVRTHERVSWQFWAAAGAGTAALLAFALSRGGAEGGDLYADALIACAVVASSWCYVEGASVTKTMPGWQVISWVVVLALPVTIPASIVIWLLTHASHTTTAGPWISLVLLGVSSMYVGFFAWYRGLALGGVAKVSQVQLAQPLLTVGASVVLFGQHLDPVVLLAALAVLGCVAAAQRTRVAAQRSGTSHTAVSGGSASVVPS